MSEDLNYYQILGITLFASKIQICQAYKQLALKYHPSLKHQNENQTYKKFCLVSQAFDVLYNDQKKKIYDQCGEQKLKEGIINQEGQRGTANYVLSNQPQVIFQKFFGTKNVFEHLLSVGQGQGKSHPIFSSQYGKNANIQPRKVPDLVVPIQCCLSQLYNGCKKIKSYSKNILCLDGRNVQTITQIKQVQIPKGRSAKNPIVFKGQGNQQPGQQPSDLVFQIVQINEMGFKRCPMNSADIIYTSKISLMDALDSKSITILDGEVIQAHFDEIINPQTMRIIQGKGFERENGEGRGNLIVRFDIEFPQQIEIGKKARIVELLTVS